MAGYNELLSHIPAELHEASEEFLARVPDFIEYGQRRICRELQLSILNIEEPGSFTALDPFIPFPSTAVAMVQLGVVVPGVGVVNLRPRSLGFLTVFWPDRSVAAEVPKYWAPFDDDNIIVAPTPLTSLAWRMTTRKVKSPLGPDSLTNEITSRHYNLLLWACCERGAHFLGDDRRKEFAGRYEALYQRDKATVLGNEAEIRSDEHTERKPPPGRG